MTPRSPSPVWPGYFADPFVLRVGREYYAYGTGAGLARDQEGRPAAFEILRSDDLAHWEPAGAALPVDEAHAADAVWAPEVAERDGRFFLYYSRAPSGAEELHRIRVALAESPRGPFRDAGEVLPESVGFSIDAHPFFDPRERRWYLYFARDFFDERAGTGLAVVPLADDLRSPAAEPRTVLRAHHDWQIYQRERWHYGRTWDAWHTIEGPCVVAHAGRYYCFYSGGNWQTSDYGVGFAVAEHPLGPWTHHPATGPTVLRQVPGALLGPGHNCVVRDAAGAWWIVYHAWDPARTARRMFIDPLEWTPHGPRARGPRRES